MRARHRPVTPATPAGLLRGGTGGAATRTPPPVPKHMHQPQRLIRPFAPVAAAVGPNPVPTVRELLLPTAPPAAGTSSETVPRTILQAFLMELEHGKTLSKALTAIEETMLRALAQADLLLVRVAQEENQELCRQLALTVHKQLRSVLTRARVTVAEHRAALHAKKTRVDELTKARLQVKNQVLLDERDNLVMSIVGNTPVPQREWLLSAKEILAHITHKRVAEDKEATIQKLRQRVRLEQEACRLKQLDCVPKTRMAELQLAQSSERFRAKRLLASAKAAARRDANVAARELRAVQQELRQAATQAAAQRAAQQTAHTAALAEARAAHTAALAEARAAHTAALAKERAEHVEDLAFGDLLHGPDFARMAGPAAAPATTPAAAPASESVIDLTSESEDDDI